MSQQIVYKDVSYTISEEVQMRFPELVSLIFGSESIDEPEQKQYWFDMLGSNSMTDNQIDRLFNILMTEKQELEKLDLAFQEDVKRLNEKHQIEWQALQSQKAKEKIAEAEKNSQKENPDDILNSLNLL